ncbi:MAG: translation initiation factor IF-2 [Armatimonadota bacterium]|nr:MAG: translation initiation factor IF-2 [Armatimonadota bacterium]
MKVIELSKELGIALPKLKATLDELGVKARTVNTALKDADALRVAETLGKGDQVRALLEAPVAAAAEPAPAAPAEAPAGKPAAPTTVRKIPKAKVAEKAPEQLPDKAAAVPRAPAGPEKRARPTKPAEPKVSKVVAPLLRVAQERRPKEAPAGALKPPVRLRVPPRRLPTIRRARAKARTEKEPAQPKPTKQPVAVSTAMSVKEFAALLKSEPARLLGALLDMGIVANVNKVLEPDALTRVGAALGREVTIEEPTDEALEAALEASEARAATKQSLPRSPIVTVLGHVDHGKTTLLDTIRHAKVTEQEVGGITQHIGAYHVEVGGKGITFVDTPGHEAFTAMRARGANVTDIAVLVVAADDGVMPQTIEAINHARAAGVPIIVAVNKIDRPQANPERTRQQLAEQGLTPEEWGGDTVFVNISALNGTGIDSLLEMILVVAEVQELKADPDAPATATVIEAELDRRVGPLVTALVREGTLRTGDAVVAGLAGGKIRAMLNDTSEPIAEAGPAMPAVIMGLDTVPEAGDTLELVDDERAAKQVASSRQNRHRANRIQAAQRMSLEDLYQRIEAGEVKELNVVLKADVQGSVEAISQSLTSIEHPEVRVRVIHAGVGDISDSDVMLAQASQAVIIGFHVNIESAAREVAGEQGVDVRIYQVIYDLLDDVKAAMTGMLEPEYETVLTGRAEVRQLFKISRLGTIAGCYVTEGTIARGADVRVLRGDEVVHEGKIASLRHLKDDVREIGEGFECGIGIEGFEQVEPGDVIQAFTMREVRREVI